MEVFFLLGAATADNDGGGLVDVLALDSESQRLVVLLDPEAQVELAGFKGEGVDITCSVVYIDFEDSPNIGRNLHFEGEVVILAYKGPDIRGGYWA